MSNVIKDSSSNIERLILLKGEEPAETIHEFWQRKERRIIATRKRQTVNLIKAVERAWENEWPEDACDMICRMMRMPLKSKVKYWSTRARYGGLRLYPDDFEEKFWDAVQTMVLQDYNGGDFWLYENILKKIDSKALDLIRWAKRKRRKHAYTADVFLDIPDPSTSHVEDDVASCDLIQQMMLEPSLSDQERSLLRFLYDEPDAYLQQISDHLQLGHRETETLEEPFETEIVEVKQHTTR